MFKIKYPVRKMTRESMQSRGSNTRSREYSPETLRDQEKINQLKKQYDMNHPEELRELYRILNSGQVRFESRVGQEFDDEVYEAFQKVKNSLQQKKSDRTNQKSAEKQKRRNPQKSESKKEIMRLEDYDEQMQAQIRLELKKTERRRKFMVISLFLTAILCIGYFAGYYIKAARSEKRWESLAGLVGSDALAGQGAGQQTVPQIHLTEDEIVVPEVLDKYITLYNSNKNLIGWLKIDDTIIDYPVMQCDNNTYYLNHNFDQEEDKTGTLFLDCGCDVIRGSDNYIIYGHHVTSGKMFSKLSDYESERYYQNHPYITFDTIYEEATYQVMYAFRSRIYNEDEVVFKYYQFIDAYSEEEFNSYMQEMAELSYYDTGVTAVYGDQLLTLSTCDYQETNGRFVVVAKRIR